MNRKESAAVGQALIIALAFMLGTCFGNISRESEVMRLEKMVDDLMQEIAKREHTAIKSYQAFKQMEAKR